ncbi:MAG: hypothetical protein ACWGQW_04100 [bacterium]
MKRTMNGRDIVKFHKLLEQEIPHAKIVKLMGVDADTLKRFTPDKVNAAKQQAKEKQAAAFKQRKEAQDMAVAAMTAARSAMNG